MNWISVVILAIVEGLTEFLPVSSTGHMIIASNILRIPQTDFLSSFEIVVQLGAILAVLSIYGSLLWKRKEYWPLIIAAFVPTSVIGFLGYKMVKTVFLGNVTVTMIGLLVGGIFLLLSKRFEQKTQSLDNLTIRQAIFIGLLQAMSIIPGVSRSASTIIGGEIVGLSRKAAVEFSFLLGMPVLAAASGYDLLKSGFVFTGVEWLQLGLGTVISFIVARLTVNWLVSFVERKSLTIFGWYRVGLAAVYFTSLWVLGR